MDKLIDDIIDVILVNMDCQHEVDHDEGGVHTSVEYSLNNETKLRGMIGELIDKSREELFEIKVQEYERGLKDAKPAVDEGFINTWAKELEADLKPYSVCVDIDKEKLKSMLKEAGVEVVEQ
jgi:copper chaperone CopZ